MAFEQSSLRTARLSVLTAFFINGAIAASWVPHIPLMQDRLGLSEAALGFVLLAFVCGSVVSLLLSSWLMGRFGSRLVTSVSTIGFCLTLPLPVLAPNLPVVVASLALFGLWNGAMDVSMNAQGVAVEERFDRHFMSSFHGLFSVGGLAGAGLAGLALAAGVSPAAHVLVASVVLCMAGLIAIRGLLPSATGTHEPGAYLAIPTGPLMALGTLAFLAILAEGAMVDWSAVYLRNELGVSAGLASAGFAIFSLTMAIGRLSGDAIRARIGSVTLLRVSSGFAAAGMTIALLVGSPISAIIGFGCLGLGLSNSVPVLFGAAGRTPGVNAGTGLSAVATAGYMGAIAGPPLIGSVAEAVSLTWALGLVAVSVGLVAVFAHTADRSGSQRS